MQEQLSKDIDIADGESQYDMQCKNVLSNKIILAWILKYTADEFKNFDIEEIQCCIENPEVSNIKVNPGETNTKKIVGANTENGVVGEGTIYYDIRFCAYVPRTRDKIKLIINVEAQKSFYPGYPIVSRGIFYGARMISAQSETEFMIPNYGDVKKVYSIWLCMNTPRYIGNAISQYSLCKKDILPGIPNKVDEYDKLSIIIVCINEKADNGNDLTEMLKTLLSLDIKAEEKKITLEKKYQIPMRNDFGEELSLMCNLSDLAVEKGKAEGKAEGRIEAFIELIKDGMLTIEDAAKRLGISEAQFKSYID